MRGQRCHLWRKQPSAARMPAPHYTHTYTRLSLGRWFSAGSHYRCSRGVHTSITTWTRQHRRRRWCWCDSCRVTRLTSDPRPVLSNHHQRRLKPRSQSSSVAPDWHALYYQILWWVRCEHVLSPPPAPHPRPLGGPASLWSQQLSVIFHAAVKSSEMNIPHDSRSNHGELCFNLCKDRGDRRVVIKDRDGRPQPIGPRCVDVQSLSHPDVQETPRPCVCVCEQQLLRSSAVNTSTSWVLQARYLLTGGDAVDWWSCPRGWPVCVAALETHTHTHTPGPVNCNKDNYWDVTHVKGSDVKTGTKNWSWDQDFTVPETVFYTNFSEDPGEKKNVVK